MKLQTKAGIIIAILITVALLSMGGGFLCYPDSVVGSVTGTTEGSLHFDIPELSQDTVIVLLMEDPVCKHVWAWENIFDVDPPIVLWVPDWDDPAKMYKRMTGKSTWGDWEKTGRSRCLYCPEKRELHDWTEIRVDHNTITVTKDGI